MSHPKPPPSDQQYSLDNNLASWLGSPKHVYASWIHRKSLRTSTKIVYIAMFNRYVDWLADEHQIPFHLSTPKLISTFLDSSNPNQSKSRQKPMTSRQRQQYVRLIEHAFDEMGRLGLNIPNPGRLAGFAKIGKGKDDDTRFLNLVEREKLVAFVQTRTDELRKAKAGLEEWVEYRDLALVGVLVGAGLKVGQAKSLSLNCIRAGVRKADVNGLGAGLDLSEQTGTSHSPRILPFAVPLLDQWLLICDELRASSLAAYLVTKAKNGSVAFPANRKTGNGSAKHNPTKLPHLSAASIFRRTHKMCERAGIEGKRVTAQTLRNTYAAFLFDQNIADELIMHYLGLRTLSTVARLRAAYEGKPLPRDDDSISPDFTDSPA